MVEDYLKIYFICTAKFLTFSDIGHFWAMEEYFRIYFICTAKFYYPEIQISYWKFITHLRNSGIFRIYFICTAKFYYSDIQISYWKFKHKKGTDRNRQEQTGTDRNRQE